MVITQPALGGSITDARGADSESREDCAMVYFVADGTANKVYRYTIREGEEEIRQLWDDFLLALGESRFNDARSYIHPLFLEKYDYFIKRMGIHATKLANDFCPGSALQVRTVCNLGAEFILMSKVNNVKEGPRVIGGILRFMRDESGEWKIAEF